MAVPTIGILLAGSVSPALAARLPLPAPATVGAPETGRLCAAVGCTSDRLKVSVVPGTVVNDEVVRVGLTGNGAPGSVLVDQHLLVMGVGDYVVRERGPARSATSLVAGSDPPVTKLGAVVWQGFTPGARRLGARLNLDPVLESGRLPLTVAVTYRAGGTAAPRALGPGGMISGSGTVTVRLANATGLPADLPAADADLTVVAAALDTALAAARVTDGSRLPAAGAGLPVAVPAGAVTLARRMESVPLRITGSIGLIGTTGAVSGPGTTPVPGGGAISGTLSDGTLSEGALSEGAVELTVQTTGAGRLLLDLTVVPVLDVRTLRPPAGARTWAAWARTRPGAVARRDALDLLVSTAATGARAAAYSPYLGAELRGTGSTVFRYSMAPPAATRVTAERLHPKPRAIAVAALVAVLILVTAGLIWQRS